MIALLFAASLLLFLASWIYLPAPNRTLLALGVGAPELALWLALGGLVVTALTLVIAGHRSRKRLTLVLSVVATMLAAGPLVQLPFVILRFDAAMTVALGADFLRGVPPDRLNRMRPSAVSLRRFVGLGDDVEARVTRGILFAAPVGVRLTLDVYRPTASGRYPAIVQIYGGAWQRGTPADEGQFARYLASRGYVVFAIDYRHAPTWTWPAQIEDVRTALAWIRLHAGDYDANASRLALVGRSAGAHLAMLAAYDSRAPIAAIVSYYGPVDLTEGYRNPPVPDPLDVRAIEEAFIGGTPERWPDRYRAASPITYVSGRLPPTLLIYGSRDHVVLSRFGATLAARLRDAGATSVFLEIPWAEHAFDAIPNGTSGQLSLYYTERFLAWALTRAGSDPRPARFNNDEVQAFTPARQAELKVHGTPE
jgi:acetyl esterase/lipase